MTQDALSQLRDFFSRDACRKATAPLSDGIEIALVVESSGEFTLVKRDGKLDPIPGAPTRPDMTFHIGARAIDQLSQSKSDDIGQIGINIITLMASRDPELQIRPKVHIGLFDMLRRGYFSVLPLGGATVAKHLASHGFGGISKIKDAISRLRG